MRWAFIIKGIVLICAIPAGAFFGWLGYDLYKLGVASAVSTGGSWKQASFWFNGAGPGLGFAAVGGIIIISAIWRKFEEEDVNPSGGRRVTRGSRDGGPS